MAQSQKGTTDGYVPGVCNINYEEIAKRRRAGYLGIGIAIVLLIIFLALGLNRYIRLILFLPLFLGAIGMLQAKNKFCVGYGAAGLQNASEGSSEASKVSDKTAILKDKTHARKMNLQAAAMALILTLLLLLIPT